MPTHVTMRQMLEAGVHFGHQARYWNPKMVHYIFGERNRIHIINLEKTMPLFSDAMNFLGKVASKRGTVLFVGTKRAAQAVIEEQAKRANMPYVSKRWLGGMLTNFKTIKQSVRRLKELEAMAEDGSLDRLNKKERMMLKREQDKLDRSLGGIKAMDALPDVLFIVDVEHEKIAIKEAQRLGIPTVAVVDTNSDPNGIDYPIPGNDDAIRAIQLYVETAADSILEGRVAAADLSGRPDEFVEMDEKEIQKIEAKVKKPAVIKTPKKKIVDGTGAEASEITAFDVDIAYGSLAGKLYNAEE